MPFIDIFNRISDDSLSYNEVYNYIDDPSAGFDLFGGGITFIGGLIGGAISGGFSMAALIFGKRTKNVLFKLLIALITTVIVVLICGLIGIAILGSL